jgi:microcystin degradation protein MlrC
MVAAATRMVAYRTYPHLDTLDRGKEAMDACLAHAAGTPRSAVAHRKLPLLMPLLAQATEPGGPMEDLLGCAAAWRAKAGIDSVSLVPGFPYADVEDAGASVLVYAGKDQELANSAADDLAACWWNLREHFRVSGSPPDLLLEREAPGTTIVADIADNPGAGAASRDTSLLRYFLDYGLQPSAFACLVEPAAVETCHQAGIGALVALSLGDPPLPGQWRIDHLGDGVFTHRGPMASGAVNRIGRTATVSRAGISVILCERRVQVVDPAVFPACGIAPDGCRWLVVKSSVHFRAAFREIATGMIEIEGQGPCTSDLSSLSSKYRPRPIWPLDLDAGWTGIGSVERCAVE